MIKIKCKLQIQRYSDNSMSVFLDLFCLKHNNIIILKKCEALNYLVLF